MSDFIPIPSPPSQSQPSIIRPNIRASEYHSGVEGQAQGKDAWRNSQRGCGGRGRFGGRPSHFGSNSRRQRHKQNHGRAAGRSNGRYRKPYSGNLNENTEVLQVNNDLVNVEEIGYSIDTDRRPNADTDSGDNTDAHASPQRTAKIAVQGCAHGALDRIYETLQLYEEKQRKESKGGGAYKIDLLICCGDFQSLRNKADLDTMAVPRKYQELGTFYQYYAGLKKAPYLTIFVGGNHEASAYLQELTYGGWVAPNIYYLGAAGVVTFRGLRIAGASGIFKRHDYNMGRHEQPPYDHGTLRSVYHVRNVDVARLKCLALTNNNNKSSRNIDVMISHDWPRGIEQHGNTAALLRKKKYFAKEIHENDLGSPANEELLNALKPTWWFAAHLHVKFNATYRHNIFDKTKTQPEQAPPTATTFIPSQVRGALSQNNAKSNNVTTNQEPTKTTTFLGIESPVTQCAKAISGDDLTDMMTKFLSLDKCLPRRHYLQIINIPIKEQPLEHHNSCNSEASLHYDLEWLAILQKTHHWTNKYKSRSKDPDITNVRITQEDMDEIREALNRRGKCNETNEKGSSNSSYTDHTRIPNDFVMTAHPHGTVGSDAPIDGGRMIGNPQTDKLLSLLDLDHIVTVPYLFASRKDVKNKSPPCKETESLRTDSDHIELKSSPARICSQNRPQPDDNEIILESESESDGNQTIEEMENVRQPLSKDINLLQCHVKQEKKVEAKLSECDHDSNEIELNSDSEESDNNLNEINVVI